MTDKQKFYQLDSQRVSLAIEEISGAIGTLQGIADVLLMLEKKEIDLEKLSETLQRTAGDLKDANSVLMTARLRKKK